METGEEASSPQSGMSPAIYQVITINKRISKSAVVKRTNTTMSPPVVLIIGCGIAGPVLGNFFKRKGYQPIVFEKVPELGVAGASLMLMSNG